MIKELILNNLFFATNIFLFLALFAAFWLHLDSWKINKKNIAYLSRSIGFLFLSLSFLLTATETDNQLIIYLINISKCYGTLMFFGGLVSSKTLTKPSTKNLAFIPPTLKNLNLYLPFLTPLFYLLGVIYLAIKVTKGLEKQLKGLLISYTFLFISETLRIFYFWSDTNNVFLNNLLSKFGLITIIILVLNAISAIILLKWVWGYVRFRAGIQIFISTLSLTLLIFVITTFSFTYLLIKNIETNLLQSLETDARVALYSIERLQFEALANSKAVSTNSILVTTIEDDDEERMFRFINTFLLDQNLSFLDIADKDGKLILSASDKDLRNISFSEDPTFKSAVQGKALTTIYKKDGAVSPIIEVRASSPIVNNEGEIIGTVISGFLVDNPLLDGIKELTGLEITVFGDNVRSASTINLDEQETRYLGVSETNQDITDEVIKNNRLWSGKGRIANKSYYTVYLPLKSYNEKIIGMVSVAKPESVISKLTENSIQSTFLVSVVLMIISTIPSYFVAKYIEDNTTA